MTLAQVPLHPSVTTSGGSAAALSRRTGLSIRTSMRQQAREYLVHLLSVASLTGSPSLVEAVVVHLFSITRLRTAKRAYLEALLLPDCLASPPNDIKDLLSIARYVDYYLVACGDHITKKMWSEMKNEHYVIF